MKLVTRINAMVGISILTVCVICGLTVYWTTSELFDKESAQELAVRQWSVDADILRHKTDALGFANQLASRPDFIEAILQTNTAALRLASQEVCKHSGFSLITIANSAGVVIARAHSEKTGDSVLSQLNVRRALAGDPLACIEEGTVVKFSLRAGAPVRQKGKIVGCITVGFDLTSNAFVDSIKHQYKTEATIFQSDMRVATTLMANGNRLIGTRMDNPLVLDTVQAKGGVFNHVNKIQGRDYNSIYWPLKDGEGKVVGMFFLGKDRDSIRAAFAHFAKVTLSVLVFAACLCLGASALAGRVIAKQISEVIQAVGESSRQIDGAAREVASASQSLAEGSSEQAASLEETGASLEEISGMARSNAEGAKHVTDLLSTARAAADSGGGQMMEMSRAMDEIQAASNSIAKIIKTIDEIAFQTNILALNAAVEAARAGEAGLGFAVVAEEVRNLAQRAAHAAKETASLIEDSKQRSELGVQLNQKVSTSLSEIVSKVREASEIGAGAAQAAQEESRGVEQINQTVSQLDKLTQSNAATAEESASAAQELNGQAARLREAISTLNELVHGTNVKSGIGVPEKIPARKIRRRETKVIA